MIDSLYVRDYCYLSGDGRCDGPGHSVKYLTSLMLDQATNTIVSMSVTQVTETGNSSNMEKLGSIKALNNLKEENLQIKQITRDWPRKIQKFIHKEQIGNKQQFDI